MCHKTDREFEFGLHRTRHHGLETPCLNCRRSRFQIFLVGLCNFGDQIRPTRDIAWCSIVNTVNSFEPP
jgi:hypothetical protein